MGQKLSWKKFLYRIQDEISRRKKTLKEILIDAAKYIVTPKKPKSQLKEVQFFKEWEKKIAKKWRLIKQWSSFDSSP